MKKGKIFILSGPSGVGKRTVRDLLDLKSLNLINSVSWTTRNPRAEDEEGVTYHFVTPEEFQTGVANDCFLEYEGFDKSAYGTPAKPVEDAVNSGTNIMLEIEVKGAATVMQKKPEAVSIFLVPPSMEELESRLRSRNTEKEERILSRLETAKSEMPRQKDYKYVVVNDDATRAANEIAEIIRKETDCE